MKKYRVSNVEGTWSEDFVEWNADEAMKMAHVKFYGYHDANEEFIVFELKDETEQLAEEETKH